MVEDFLVRKRLAGNNFEELSARRVEAFLILEKALEQETDHGRNDTRRPL